MIRNLNLIIFCLIIFIMTLFNSFTNTYIILKNNYENRLVNSYGDCSKTGYGFLKKILNKFPEINGNLDGINLADYPLATGYFWNPKLEYTQDYFVLINFDNEDYTKFNKKNFVKIYQDKNCYLLKKND